MDVDMETLENYSNNFEDIDGKHFYMKKEISNFNTENTQKIDFDFCHIAISRNGGLIAICKKEKFFDTSKNSRLNKYVIVMSQNGRNIFEIPIDWNYNSRWIVCLDFTENQDLYGILNDGGIMKFNYNENTYKEKVTSEKLKKEGVRKAKFFLNGFIAYTTYECFYYIKNIKDPVPILLYNPSGLIKLSEKMDFLAIPNYISSSSKIELLITTDERNGVIHTEFNPEGYNLQFKLVDDNKNTAILGLNLIKNGQPQPFLMNDTKDDENDYPKGFGKISAIAISGNERKIAFYNSKHNVGFIMNADFIGKYSKVCFK